MTRYFPELVEAVRAELPERCVVDGEIVIATGERLDFEALQQRIHPAAVAGATCSPSRRRRRSSPSTCSPWATTTSLAALRRAARGRLLEALADARPVHAVTPATTDVDAGATLVHRVRGRRPRRRDRQAARRRCTSRTSG